MSKVDIAFNRIMEVVFDGHDHQWELPDLLWSVNYALDLESMVSLSTLRRAVARLPEGCATTKGRKMVVHARHYAPPEAVIGALKDLPHFDYDLPVMIERHKHALRKALFLADESALYQSLLWASANNERFTYAANTYGDYVRFKGA